MKHLWSEIVINWHFWKWNQCQNDVSTSQCHPLSLVLMLTWNHHLIYPVSETISGLLVVLVDMMRVTKQEQVLQLTYFFIMGWVPNENMNELGISQETCILKWEWYIQGRNKQGINGVSDLVVWYVWNVPASLAALLHPGLWGCLRLVQLS